MMEKTVMTAKELAAQIKFRAAVVTFIKLQARDRIKQRIRADGQKVSAYTARELSEMADEYLLDPAHRDELVAKAREWAKDILTKRR
jgi:hypothetical protein